LAAGERDELMSEYHSVIDQQRLEKFHELNTLVGKSGEIDRNLLKRRIVILVADGLPDGFLLDLAADFLKPVALKRLVMAIPLASVPAVDRMHLLADELHVLSVPENYMDTNHYYDDNKVPDLEGLVKVMQNISLEWDNPRFKR
jgi:predicted phosphoribosyltransferase